ncbi:MAG: hypothetical protein GQ582_06810 [Methyloprofundus sp.]|nr:hypothetical protein [Methyloprofundus sp.]
MCRSAAILWLVAASLFFYAWWNPVYLWLLIFSIAFNYTVGVILCSKNKSKLLLIIGISVNILLLTYFKYTNFLVDNINEVFNKNYNIAYIALPLAISFFTFQQIAYLVGAYRSKVHEYNFLHYSLFVVFFPQLIAGPIVYHKEMLPQFEKNETFVPNISNISMGVTIFIIGLFKKVVLADEISNYSSPSPYTQVS